MLCSAQVARHFDPPPTENPMQALTAIAIVVGVTVGATVLAIGGAQLSLSTWAYITATGCVESGTCEKLVDDLAPKMAATGARVAPQVQDPKLQHIVVNLFKWVGQPNQIGDGTTMAAIRYEVQNGLSKHLIKGQETMNGLVRILNDPNVSLADKAVAGDLLNELSAAFQGR
jgi:hypothetical protein